MIVVDTLAWVEFQRGMGSLVHREVASLVQSREVLVPDVVRLELLAAAGSEDKAADLARLLARFVPLPASSSADHEYAASLYRTARSSGEIVRSLLDCLIAAMAVRADAPVLERDREFEVLARSGDVQLHAVGREASA